jgi:hypothetical protein
MERTWSPDEVAGPSLACKVTATAMRQKARHWRSLLQVRSRKAGEVPSFSSGFEGALRYHRPGTLRACNSAHAVEQQVAADEAPPQDGASPLNLVFVRTLGRA